MVAPTYRMFVLTNRPATSFTDAIARNKNLWGPCLVLITAILVCTLQYFAAMESKIMFISSWNVILRIQKNQIQKDNITNDHIISYYMSQKHSFTAL